MTKNNRAAKSDAVVFETQRSAFFRRRWFVIGLVIVVLVAGGGGYAAYVHHRHEVAATNRTEQRSLQARLATTINNDYSNQTMLSITNQLIAGANNGKFTISESNLAPYYLDRASALLGLERYQQALADYKSADKADHNVTGEAALQGEAQAENALGQKQVLVSTLQQLIRLEQSSTNPDPFMASDVAHYQDVINAIQNNRRYEL